MYYAKVKGPGHRGVTLELFDPVYGGAVAYATDDQVPIGVAAPSVFRMILIDFIEKPLYERYIISEANASPSYGVPDIVVFERGTVGVVPGNRLQVGHDLISFGV